LQVVFDCNFTYICDPIQHSADGSPENSIVHIVGWSHRPYWYFCM